MSQRIDRQQHERELVDLHEGWKNRERELLAHIERLNAQLSHNAASYRKWWEESVDKPFEEWSKEEEGHWLNEEDAAYQAWNYVHESVAYPLMKDVERLEAQLAEAKNLFLHERTEGLTDQEQQEEWDDAEEYFDRQMEYAAKKAAHKPHLTDSDKGE